MEIGKIQAELKRHNIDGWLLYDFHNRDPLAYRVLGLEMRGLASRRWFYYIPAEGEPVKLAHAVEKYKIDSLPGKKIVYLPWKQLHSTLEEILGEPKKIAMQYSPYNNIPYVSLVDGGTIELIRKFGHTVVSSADLIQTFEAVIDEEGYKTHLQACKKVQMIKDEAFSEISKAIKNKTSITEYDIAQFILRRFEEEGMETHDSPIVGVNGHQSDCHFEPTKENTHVIKEGDWVLIDLWARINKPGAIYYDITWCGYVGDNIPEKYVKIFNIVKNARNTAVQFIRDKFAKDESCYGWEVDDACRNVIKEADYGDYFVHRTGHSIGEEIHGNGVHIDNLETKEERQLVPGICFSIEPGIYIEGVLGVRSEINVFITLDKEVVVAGDEQEELLKL